MLTSRCKKLILIPAVWKILIRQQTQIRNDWSRLPLCLTMWICTMRWWLVVEFFSVFFSNTIILIVNVVIVNLKLWVETREVSAVTGYELLIPYASFIMSSCKLHFAFYPHWFLGSPVPNEEGFVEFRMAGPLKYMWWYHVVGLIWISEFILACQQMTVAGAVVTYYFTR